MSIREALYNIKGLDMNIQYSNSAKIGSDTRCCIAWEAEFSPVIL